MVKVNELGKGGQGPLDGEYFQGTRGLNGQHSYRSKNDNTLSFKSLGIFKAWILNSPSFRMQNEAIAILLGCLWQHSVLCTG